MSQPLLHAYQPTPGLGSLCCTCKFKVHPKTEIAKKYQSYCSRNSSSFIKYANSRERCDFYIVDLRAYKFNKMRGQLE